MDITQTILIIDDDLGFQYVLKRLVEGEGHEVLLADSIRQGLELAAEQNPVAVFLDIGLPDGNGVEDALPALCRLPDKPEIIMITGLGSEDEAEKALLQGAYDYISKNTPMEDILATLSQALELHRSRTAQKAAAETGDGFDRSGLVGSSEPMARCIEQARQSSATDVNVLLLGETGTGKEVFARTIHDNSTRRNRPFVAVDCACLPEKLAASILFGHVKGAFTSADAAQDGLVAKANGGTLFLDEIGELTPEVQKVFLRVLQERRFRPVGGTREISCDFRLIAATNKDLYALSQDGGFRNDLYYRLQTCVIELPPLRERGGDVVDLAAMLVRSACERSGQPVKSCGAGFLDALAVHPWEGNVRELENAMEFAVSMAGSGESLSVHHLPPPVRIHAAKAKFARANSGHGEGERLPMEGDVAHEKEFPDFNSYKEVMGTQFEQAYIRRVHAMSGGDIHRMMELSGLSRSRCYALVKQYVK